MSQIRKGIVLSFTSIFLVNAISLFFTPYMLNKLGKAEYGLYVLVGSLIGYLGLLTFGLGSTLVRYIARYQANCDKQSEENLLAMALIVYGIMSVLVLMVGSAIWYLLPNIFPKLTPYELNIAKIMFALLLVSMALTVPGSIFTTVQTAYGRFVFSQSVGILTSVLRFVIVSFLLYLNYKVIAIVAVDVSLAFAGLLLNVRYVFKVMHIRIRLHHFNTPLLREIFIFSFWIFLNMVMDQIYWKFGQTVLGVTSGTASIAVFAVGIQLAMYFMSLSSAVSGVFLPRAVAMDTHNASNEEMTSLMIRVGRFQFLVLGLALVGFISLGRLFILNWLGAEYLSSWGIALVIMIPLSIPLVQNFGISILQAKNKHAARSIIYIIISIVNVVIGYMLSLRFGGFGMAIGTALSLIMGQGIAINLYYNFKIGLNMPRFFKELSKGLLFCLFIIVLFGQAAAFLPGNGWQGFFYKGLLVVLAYILMMWKFGLNELEKTELKLIYRKLLEWLGFVERSLQRDS